MVMWSEMKSPSVMVVMLGKLVGNLHRIQSRILPCI